MKNLSRFLDYTIYTMIGLIALGYISSNIQFKADPFCNVNQNFYNQNILWKEKNFPIVLELDKSVPKELRDSVYHAAEKWNKELKKEVLLIKESSVKLKHDKNKINSIIAKDSWEIDKASEQARTRVFFEGNNILEADVIINLYTFSFYNKKNVVKGKTEKSDLYHFESLMIHEFGHVLGFIHDDNHHSVMNSLLAAQTERPVAQFDVNSFACAYGNNKNLSISVR